MSDKLIFTVGFTDAISDDWTVQDPNAILDDKQTSYNLKKMVTDEEKWSASWEIDMSKRHNQIVFHNWETIIRAPHLRMVDFFESDVPFIDDYKTRSYQLSFINLIPVKGFNTEAFDYNNDTENAVATVPWGSIYLDLNTMIATGNRSEAPLMQEFLFNESTTRIPELLDMRISPKFNFQFPIGFDEFGSNRVNTIAGMNPDARQKYETYKQELTDVGFTEMGILNFAHNGMLEVGKLIEDPVDIIDKLNESPYICRASLTKPE